jgi:hypothetical protein
LLSCPCGIWDGVLVILMIAAPILLVTALILKYIWSEK